MAELGTDATNWQGFALGVAFRYDSTAISLDIPWLWSANGDVGGETWGITNGQVAIRLSATVGFDL